MDGATAVFHCIHAAYSAKAWTETLPRAEELVLAAAGERGIPVVFPESLYSYSNPEQPMAEDSPRNAAGGKRGVRTALLNARAASGTNTVSVVASDFYGPRVETAHAGARMLESVFGGRRLLAIGNPVAAALIHLHARPCRGHGAGRGAAGALERRAPCAHGAAVQPAGHGGSLRGRRRPSRAQGVRDARRNPAGRSGWCTPQRESLPKWRTSSTTPW